MRTFENPNQLSQILVVARLHTLDPFADAICENQPYLFGGQMVDHFVVRVESSLTDEQINEQLSTTETESETAMISAFSQAWSGYANLPNYIDKTAAELIALVDGNWFGGKSLAQIQADIDASANYKVAMKALAAYLYSFRDFYVHRAIELDTYVRDCYIRPRR